MLPVTFACHLALSASLKWLSYVNSWQVVYGSLGNLSLNMAIAEDIRQPCHMAEKMNLCNNWPPSLNLSTPELGPPARFQLPHSWFTISQLGLCSKFSQYFRNLSCYQIRYLLMLIFNIFNGLIKQRTTKIKILSFFHITVLSMSKCLAR